MIRILYITDSLMLGGIETQLVDLVVRLDRSRFQPGIVCLYGPDARDLHFTELLREHDIPIYQLNRQWSTWDKVRIVTAISSVTRAFRPDIVQAENYHANFLSRAARHISSMPILIGTQRGVYTAKQLRYERLTASLCNLHIVSADHLAEQLHTKARIDPHRIRVIHNAIDVPRFAKITRSDLRCSIAPDARRVFLAIGRISAQKRMHLIAEGMGLLKQQGRLPADVHVIIVGPIQDRAMQQRLDDAITRYGLRSQITVLPGTTAPEQLYAVCDATILYSVDESYPCVMMESLAAGRPVLISDVANAANVIEDNKTGWIVPAFDREAFVERLWQAIVLPEGELLRMQRTSASLGQQFSLDHLIMAYQNLYQELSNAQSGLTHLSKHGDDHMPQPSPTIEQDQAAENEQYSA